MPKPEAFVSVMMDSYEYYSMRRQAINRKLRHAQTATKCSLREITENQQPDNDENIPEAIAAIDTYDKLWADVIARFSESFMPEGALEKIEEILLALPKMIMKFYKILVTQDTTLQKLLTELLSDKYKRAQEAISAIQSKPCPLSGLGPEEFSFPEDAVKINSSAARAYRISAPTKTKHRD